MMDHSRYRDLKKPSDESEIRETNEIDTYENTIGNRICMRSYRYIYTNRRGIQRHIHIYQLEKRVSEGMKRKIRIHLPVQ